MKNSVLVATAVLGAIASQSASAALSVRRQVVGGTISTVNYPINQPVTLTVDNVDRFLWIYSTDPGNESLPRVTISGTGVQQIDVVLSANVNATIGTSPVASAGVNSAGIDIGRPNIRFIGAISGNLTGGLIAPGIWRFDADGAVQATITNGLTPTDAAGQAAPFLVEVGSVASNGVVEARAGKIGLVRVLGIGDMLGTLRATATSGGGSITSIDVVGGDIGTATTPATIVARTTASNNLHIGNIHAANLHASISTGVGGSPHVAVNTITIDEDIGAASVISLSYVTTLRVGRDFAGALNMNQALASVSQVIIDRTLASGAAINLPASGLAGQVTLNNDNVSGAWSGSVSVGGSAISGAPYYTATAASLGGGSVGLASFALHEESCFPPHNSSMSGTMLDIGSAEIECVPVDANEAILRFYGPVAISGSGAAVKVEFDSFAPPTSWTTVTSDFLTAIDSADHRHVVVTRNPSLGAAWPVGRYRMTRLTDRLLCEGVGAGSPPQVQTFTYIVDVTDECEGLLAMFDLNDDGAVSVAGDVPVWLDTPTNFNGDGVANSADLDLLLQAADLDDE